ncbi:Uu.00g060210.m01.CDS01 [Anthostomella pinea]|uniref:Uu.00g060210.m01.CDS01 n=1 Tax=Anthostomella pinea TaxID=933095 RepID=A0AAI8VS59_9PEZI|nr:Uu.00g060210.m01.CDS01 [Anthostomella pinea]
MPTTENAIFPFKAGMNVSDPETDAAKVVESTFATLRTVDGMRQINFGSSVENPTDFQLMVEWDSLQSHKDFMASSTYGPFLDRFMSLVDGEPKMMHADFKPEGNATKCLSAPATEIATFYFDGEPPSDYFENVKKATEGAFKDADGILGWAVGTTHEEVAREGVKGKAAVLLIGWQSVDQHMAFRNTQVFRDNIHLLRGSAKRIEMHHVNPAA